MVRLTVTYKKGRGERTEERIVKAKHVDGMGDAVEVVIPKEASVAAPYAISLVKNGPNPNAGKLWLNFIMSEAGQSLFAQGFVRPSVPGIILSPEVQARMPAAPQLRPLDVVKASEQKAEVDKQWAQAVLNAVRHATGLSSPALPSARDLGSELADLIGPASGAAANPA